MRYILSQAQSILLTTTNGPRLGNRLRIRIVLCLVHSPLCRCLLFDRFDLSVFPSNLAHIKGAYVVLSNV